MKEVDLGEPTSFLDHVFVGCSQRECETSKEIVDNYKMCSSPESPQQQQKNYLARGNLTQTFSHGPVIWKVMQRHVWSDIAFWRKKQPSKCTTWPHHALTNTISRKKKWDLSETCQKFALKLFWNSCMWHASVDHKFYAQLTNLHEQSPNEPELTTNAWLV